MFLAALVGLFTKRSAAPLAPARAAPARAAATAALAPPSRCFEVLVPYHDPIAAWRAGLPEDHRHALIFNVWAPDVNAALACARERFLDHRRGSSRSARLATGGPVALRIAREVEERPGVR